MKRYLKKLSLWVNNVVSRWKSSKYQNMFIDVTLFITHELEKHDRNLILHLFEAEELQYILKEKYAMEFVKATIKAHDEDFNSIEINYEVKLQTHIGYGCNICKRRKEEIKKK